MTRLVDTDILIDHLRGRPEALAFLTECLARGDRLVCSVITHAELLAGMRREEEPDVRALLGCFEAIPVDREIAEEGGRYRREWGRSHGVLLPDALIAATARIRGAVLHTGNVKHYPMVDVRVDRPYSGGG